MTGETVLGIIPARGGSKGIPGKNIKPLGEKPLIAHTIEAGRGSTVVDSVVVSTDDTDIASVAREYDSRVPFTRPKELANDDSPTAPVITHALENLAEAGESYNTFVLLQPTSPLRTGRHIDEAFEKYDEDVGSLISVYETKEARWKKTDDGAVQINYNEASNRRQDREPEYIINGAIYICDVESFLESEDITTGKTAVYEMSEAESIDIDEEFDFWLAEKILKECK